MPSTSASLKLHVRPVQPAALRSAAQFLLQYEAAPHLDLSFACSENSATKAGGSGGPPSAAGYAETWEKRVRQGFIAKVYGILCVQLAITAGIVVAFVLSDAIKQKVQNSP